MPNIIVQKRKKTAVDPHATIGIMIIIPLQKRAWRQSGPVFGHRLLSEAVFWLFDVSALVSAGVSEHFL